MFEIVGKASGLVDVFKPVNGFNPKLDGKKSEIQINAEKEVDYLENEISLKKKELEDIQREFGQEIAEMVDGVTKLKQILIPALRK